MYRVFQCDGADLLQPSPDLHAPVRRMRGQLVHEHEPSPRHAECNMCYTPARCALPGRDPTHRTRPHPSHPSHPLHLLHPTSPAMLVAHDYPRPPGARRRRRLHHPAQSRRVSHRMAVVRRCRVSRGLCDEPADAGFALHLYPRLRVRDALRESVDRRLFHCEPVHRHRHGRRGHRAAGDDPARADSQGGRHRLPGRVADDRPGRQQRMDALAPVQERRAVRRQRSHPWPRHRLLCVSPAAARSDAADRRRRRRRGAHRFCGGVRAGRRAELHEARRRLSRPQSAAASVAARRGVLPVARRQRVPGGAAPAHRCDGTRDCARRLVHRRHGADARLRVR